MIKDEMSLKKTDLDSVVNRTEVPTLKFDNGTMQGLFGTADLWPSWVADMDLKTSSIASVFV